MKSFVWKELEFKNRDESMSNAIVAFTVQLDLNEDKEPK